MTKITKETMFTELSIQIAVLQASVDKLLQLAIKPEVNYKAEKLSDKVKNLALEALSDNEKFEGEFK